MKVQMKHNKCFIDVKLTLLCGRSAIECEVDTAAAIESKFKLSVLYVSRVFSHLVESNAGFAYSFLQSVSVCKRDAVL